MHHQCAGTLQFSFSFMRMHRPNQVDVLFCQSLLLHHPRLILTCFCADKMDDKDIRTYIGQPNPDNDDNNAKESMFSYMRDQSGWNGYYSSFNREYIVHKQYTARWFFQTWTRVAESSTETEYTSYYWDNHWNNDANSPPGDGKLNWRARRSFFSLVCLTKGTRHVSVRSRLSDSSVRL